MTIDYTKTPPPAPPPQQPPGWWSRNWKWVVAVGCLLPLLLAGGCVAALVFVVFKAIRSTEVYAESVSRAQSNAAVRARLGEPVVPKWWLSGNIDASDNGGHANVTIPIGGPKGDGKIHTIADKSGGKWTYTTMEVEIGTETINLLESNSAQPESTGTTPPGG